MLVVYLLCSTVGYDVYAIGEFILVKKKNIHVVRDGNWLLDDEAVLCVLVDLYEEAKYSEQMPTKTSVRLSQLENYIQQLRDTDGFKQQFGVS